jgi:hypothetical protein
MVAPPAQKNVEVPVVLHTLLKHIAIDQNVTLKEYVTRVLTEAANRDRKDA